MKIIHFAGGGDIGGAKTHILSLGCELAKQHDYLLFSLRPGDFADEAESLGLSVVVAERPWNIPYCLRMALKTVDEFQPDIIHCHGSKANLIGALIKQRRGIPLVTTVHSDPKLDYLGSPLRQFLFGGVNALALRCMDYYMAVGNKMQSTLIERGYDPRSIFVNHNGVDFSAAPEHDPHSTDDQRNIVVGIAARLTAVKDIPTLLRAFAYAAAQEPRLYLRIAGTGEDESALRELVSELKIAERVEFCGWITDIQGFFSAVDIDVLSSLSETFPYTLLEGACRHCAVVSSRVGGIPELIRDGETGFLFEPGDASTLSEHLLLLARDGVLRRRLAEALYQRAKNEFSLRHMCDVQQQSYRRVLKRQQQAGQRSGAVICGAYGLGNSGDEAILQAIIAQMHSIDPDMPLTVLSRSPMETRLRHHTQAYHTFDLLHLWRCLSRSRLYINGGGSLMQDVTSSRSLYFYLLTIYLAKKNGCKVLMYGCGIGPVTRQRNIGIVAGILNKNVDIITLRDSHSREVLSQLGVSCPQVILSADPTVTINPANAYALSLAMQREHIPQHEPLIAFCLRNWNGFDGWELIARAADHAWRKYGFRPVFIPVVLPNDIDAAERTAALMESPALICRCRYSVEELISLLGSMRMVVGMRLHSLIFATLGCAPVVGLSYDIKVESFMHDIGAEACRPLGELTADWLIEQIDAIAAGGCARTAPARDILQHGEEMNISAARRLLNGDEV